MRLFIITHKCYKNATSKLNEAQYHIFKRIRGYLSVFNGTPKSYHTLYILNVLDFSEIETKANL